MPHIIKMTPELVVGALKNFGGEDRKELLLAYHAACREAGCPKSDELTQQIAAVAAGLNPKETTVAAELSEQEVALSILLKSGVNPFSGKGVTPTGPVIDTSVTIPSSYIGQKYGDQEGLFLGYFDLKDGKGKQPIFVVQLTDPMSFNQTVVTTGDLENGYKADPLTYDAEKGLREGKTVIAPFNILRAAYHNKDKGEFAKMFKNIGLVLSSSYRPAHSGHVRVADFRDGDDHWDYRDGPRAPSFLVRAAFTL